MKVLQQHIFQHRNRHPYLARIQPHILGHLLTNLTLKSHLTAYLSSLLHRPLLLTNLFLTLRWHSLTPNYVYLFEHYSFKIQHRYRFLLILRPCCCNCLAYVPCN